MPSLATFNANNFFLRYKFSKTYPMDRSKSSLVEAVDAAVGYIPARGIGKYSLKDHIVWDPVRRETAATALMEPDDKLPDILCVQEVENIQALRAFNERYLDGHYPFSLLIDAYDPRNIDVGVLSRFPIEGVRTHFDDKKAGERIFSRDCLEATIGLPDGKMLTLLVNHLKSKLVIKESGESTSKYHQRIKASHQRRKGQAAAVAKIVEERFAGQHDSALYAVVGDFNDTPFSRYLWPLLDSPRLTDVLREHRGLDDSWTYYWRSERRVSQIDYVLASKALAKRVRTVVQANSNRRPYLERGGLAYRLGNSGNILPEKLIHFEADPVTPTPAGSPPPEKKIPFDFDRYEAVVDNWKNNISDHCPLKVWF